MQRDEGSRGMLARRPRCQGDELGGRVGPGLDGFCAPIRTHPKGAVMRVCVRVEGADSRSGDGAHAAMIFRAALGYAL